MCKFFWGWEPVPTLDGLCERIASRWGREQAALSRDAIEGCVEEGAEWVEVMQDRVGRIVLVDSY